MTHFEMKWPSASGVELYGQGWQPDEFAAKAVVCLVHGLGEHSGRYLNVARKLNESGYAVLTFDLCGHGRSGGQRGHFPNDESILRDIDRLLEEAQKRFPDLPVFLYGHSLGGLLVLVYTLKRRPALAGVVSTSPGLRTALEKQKATLLLARLLYKILPELKLPTGLDVNGLSHDPQVIADYLADPLVHANATPAFAVTSLKMIEYVFANAKNFNSPLLLIHGTDDPISYASGSQEFAAQTTCSCTLKLWNGLYHETHNEAEKEHVLSYVVDWLDAQQSPQHIVGADATAPALK